MGVLGCISATSYPSVSTYVLCCQFSFESTCINNFENIPYIPYRDDDARLENSLLVDAQSKLEAIPVHNQNVFVM